MNFGLPYSLTSLAFFDIKDDLTGDPGCNTAHLWAPLPAVATYFEKGFVLLWNEEPVSPPVSDFMNLPAKGMSDSFLK